MRFLIMILALLTSTSCSPEDSFPRDQKPIPPTAEQPDAPESPTNKTMKITIESTRFTATLATSTSATAFKAMLPLTLSMSDYNNNEKVAGLPGSLTTTATNPGTIWAGEIMLYGSNSLVLFYETFSSSYSYTKIGQIDNTTGLKAALGRGNVTIKFEIDGD